MWGETETKEWYGLHDETSQAILHKQWDSEESDTGSHMASE